MYVNYLINNFIKQVCRIKVYTEFIKMLHVSNPDFVSACHRLVRSEGQVQAGAHVCP